MSRGLADTSIFIARETDRPLRTDLLPDEIAVSAITIGELRAGVLAAESVELRERRLATFIEASKMDPIAVDEAVAESWAKLRLWLRDNHQRMPVNDSWIAATAMALDVPVVAQDDDYQGVGEALLMVIRA